jgi:peroxiredoxin Q/BCP
MLKVGETAPPFQGVAHDGKPVSLGALRGQGVILYFFPMAFTKGCTVETKGFRDNYAELKSFGFEVIGISTDSEATQCRFAEQHGVTFPMIADQQCTISRAYDVLWPLIRVAKRVTYVLDARHTVAAVFQHEFQVSRHLDEVLRWVRTGPSEARTVQG